MNETIRQIKAEEMILSIRAKHRELPEPELTYAVEKELALRIIRQNEELTEKIHWGGDR